MLADGVDGDGSGFECRYVTLILHGAETFRISPGKLTFPVHTAGLATWRRGKRKEERGGKVPDIRAIKGK